MQKPPPPRPKSKSSDDLEKVDALDAAESRATAALRLMNDERAAREAAEAELERLRAEKLQRQLDAVAKAAQHTPKVELAPESSKPSQRPGVLTVQAKGLKVGIPIAILVPVLAAGWTGVQNYLELQRQVKMLNQIVGGYEKRFEEQDKRLQDCTTNQSGLRDTVSQLSGWFVAVLPSLGVKVPPTAGAESVPVQIDPLPLGQRRPAPVNVRTPLPAPKPPR